MFLYSFSVVTGSCVGILFITLLMGLSTGMNGDVVKTSSDDVADYYANIDFSATNDELKVCIVIMLLCDCSNEFVILILPHRLNYKVLLILIL